LLDEQKQDEKDSVIAINNARKEYDDFNTEYSIKDKERRKTCFIGVLGKRKNLLVPVCDA